MPVIPRPAEPTHDQGHARFTSLATPTRGSNETSVWTVHIEPGAPSVPHQLTREEVFVVLAGEAEVHLDGEIHTAGTGDAIVVPPDLTFELRNRGRDDLELLCCFPVGGQARLADGDAFTPPWAE